MKDLEVEDASREERNPISAGHYIFLGFKRLTFNWLGAPLRPLRPQSHPEASRPNPLQLQLPVPGGAPRRRTICI